MEVPLSLAFWALIHAFLCAGNTFPILLPNLPTNLANSFCSFTAQFADCFLQEGFPEFLAVGAGF